MNGSADFGAAANDSTAACCSCPICLSPIDPLQESFLDHCFHKFCYKCITRWVNVVAKSSPQPPASLDCPICKTKSFSIIHNCDGNFFLRDYIDQSFTDRGSGFFTEAHQYRLRSYYVQPVLEVQKVSPIKSLAVKLVKKGTPSFNEAKYDSGVRVNVQEENVDIVLHHIYGIIDSSLKRVDCIEAKSPEDKQKEFKAVVFAAAEPFLAGKSDTFADEVELFLVSGLTLEAYDDVYRELLGLKLNTQVVAGNFVDESSAVERVRANLYYPLLDGEPDEID